MAKESKANYSAYSKAYDAQRAKLAKKGLSMYDNKLSKSEYESIYRFQREDLKQKVASGQLKSIGNVNQYIVRKQAYQISETKARAMAKASRAKGMPITVAEIRNDPTRFNWNFVAEARQAGITEREISQTYFGSP